MPRNIEGLLAARDRILEISNEAQARILIGIVGKPGAGKSTVTAKLKELLPEKETKVLSQDGYHLSNAQLNELGRSDRKGAPDTFDPQSFTELLKRVAQDSKNEIYFPIFHREIEESIAAEGLISPETKIVLVEGNYLLLDSHGWQNVATHLTESWYLKIDDELRLKRLVARHIEFGKDPEFAHSWAHGTDEVNAKIIETTILRADAVLNLDSN
jgi:pantothenate kinase